MWSIVVSTFDFSGHPRTIVGEHPNTALQIAVQQTAVFHDIDLWLYRTRRPANESRRAPTYSAANRSAADGFMMLMSHYICRDDPRMSLGKHPDTALQIAAQQYVSWLLMSSCFRSFFRSFFLPFFLSVFLPYRWPANESRRAPR